MTDRPIIFSAPMVRALLDGRKTQTRRVLGNSGPGRGRSNIFSAQIGWSDSYVLDPGNANWRERDTPYAPGDRLWVREGHAMVPTTAYRMSAGVVQTVNPEDSDRACIYREGWDRSIGGFLWRSPIHMPRWASRLTLLVTDVRVQRVQEIGFEDCRAEGADPLWREYIHPQQCPEPRCDGVHYGEKWHFRSIWNSIHGPDAWDANPWVAAISFTVHRCNIDKMEEGTW